MVTLNANPLFQDWRAIWFVQSRLLQGLLRFWLIVIGYDTRSKSLNDRIYLVYAVAFFSLWIFMVLTLLADASAGFLLALHAATPLEAAAAAGMLGLVAFGLFGLYRAARRSPFVFSEADAHIVCQAPSDRRIVALVWFIAGWLVEGLFVWAAAVILGYAHLEATTPRVLAASDLPEYLLAGLRLMLIVVPLHAGLKALAWSVGALRLRGSRDLPELRWLAPLLGLALGAGWLASGSGLPAWTWPLSFPLRAGLSGVEWLSGLGVALLWPLAGLACLWLASAGMSLARAAQETRVGQAQKAAALTGQVDLAQDLARRNRLGTGSRSTRLPLRPGAWILLWKLLVQSIRGASLGDVGSWLMVLAASAGLVLAPDWGVRGWAIIVWVYLAQQLLISPLRHDLRRWWMLRALPFSSQTILLAILALPVFGACLAFIPGLAVAAGSGLQRLPAALPWLLLPGVAGVALAAAADVLRQAKSGPLLAGGAPGLTILGVVSGVVCMALPFGLDWLTRVYLGMPPGVAIPVGMIVLVALAYGLWRMAGDLLRKI